VPYIVTSASHADVYTMSFTGADPSGIAFSASGTKMFIVGAAGDEVNVYKLSTGFDVSTAVVQSG